MKKQLPPLHPALWLVALALLFTGLPQAHAQWAVGAGYQIRAGNPGHGVAVQFQRSFATAEPQLNLFVRGRAAYFPEQEKRFVVHDYGQTLRSHSYGAALGGGLAGAFGRFWPYAGLSAGYEWHVGERREGGFNWGPRFSHIDVASPYIAPFLGAGVDIVGGVRSYVEYVLPGYLNEAVPSENSGWLATGIRVQF